MRLWYKGLVPYLPRQQLLGQWRECCLIAKEVAEKGTPNHILVNKVTKYPLSHLYSYGKFVAGEMVLRGYNVDPTKFTKYFDYTSEDVVDFNELFKDWHNERYCMQCYFNLEEKYDCGGISDNEWAVLVCGMYRLINPKTQYQSVMDNSAL